MLIVRRKKLGRTSCREIAKRMHSPVSVWRSDRDWASSYYDGTGPTRVPVCQETLGELTVRWGCTVNLPTSSRRVLNTASAIHQVNDKLGFRRVLDEAELCPRTWFSFRQAGGMNDRVNFPVILRPRKHAQGKQLHLCNDLRTLRRWTTHYAGITDDTLGNPDDSYYISELINKVAEYRVFIVQGRVVCVAQKTPGNPDEIAWNVARGGRFDNVRWDDWPLKAVKYSVQAFNLSELDFGGVDVMVDAEGNCYVLEINSAPSLTSDYRQTCMAKAFDYILENGKERIPLTEERGGYRKFIHPAICERAVLL